MHQSLTDVEASDALPVTGHGRIRRWLGAIWRAHIVKVLVFAFGVLFVLILLAPDTFVTIRSGEIGVLYKRFGGGTQVDRLYGEGLTMVAPWDELFIYSTRIQEDKH